MKKYSQEITTAIFSVATAWGISSLIKIFVHIPRPFVVNGLQNTFLVSPYGSFPSTHTAAFFAFATAVFVAHRPSGILFYMVALAIAVERVLLGVHYPIDVVAGACIGAGVAYVISVHGPVLVKYLLRKKPVK